MAVAIREELRNRKPDVDCLFVGTETGLESRILPPLGFPQRAISISGIKKMGFLKSLAGVARLPGSLFQSWRILGEFKPQAVVGLGGYSSGPVVAAALARRVPSVVIEPNVVPGFTNRLLARWIDGACYAFPETAAHFPKRGRLTGIPIRSAFHGVAAGVSAEGPLRVLVFGGSRGSRPINELMGQAARRLDAARFSIRHQTGPEDLAKVAEAYRAAGFGSAHTSAYIDDMPACFAACDLVVSRAGASTIAEITASGRPSILIPFPHAADDHQRKNALALAKAGAAEMLEQSLTDGDGLADLLNRLEADRPRLELMARAAKERARPDSASKIVDLLEEVAAKRS